MLYLLEHMTKVFTRSSDLTAKVPEQAITPSFRRPADADSSVEYIVSDQKRLPDGKNLTEVRIYIHSQQSQQFCWEAAEIIHSLMTATTLSRRVDPDPQRNKPFVVSQVRQIGARTNPHNEWASSIVIEYSLKVSELNGTRQHQ